MEIVHLTLVHHAQHLYMKELNVLSNAQLVILPMPITNVRNVRRDAQHAILSHRHVYHVTPTI